MILREKANKLNFFLNNSSFSLVVTLLRGKMVACLEYQILEFSGTIVCDIEMFIKSNNLANLEHKILVKLISGMVIDYLNKVYRSIILRDIPYICEVFDAMTSHSHSFVCILNIIAHVVQIFYATMNRARITNASSGSYAEYMSEVYLQLLLVKTELTKTLKLDHKCSGIDIMTLDPNKPLFYSS